MTKRSWGQVLNFTWEREREREREVYKLQNKWEVVQSMINDNLEI